MSKAKSIEQKRPRQIKQIKLVGRTFLVEIQMGPASPVVEITAKQFNAMMDAMVEADNLDISILDRMAEICRRNFRKGKLARRLRPDTIKHIKDGYAQFFGRPWETICAANRHAEFIETRMRICRHLIEMKYTIGEIAAFFIDRDRSTIDGAIKRHEGLCETDKSFAWNARLLSQFMEKWMLDSYEVQQPQQVSIDEQLLEEANS